MKQKHVNYKAIQCGMYIYKHSPFIHATPEFLSSCDCCGMDFGKIWIQCLKHRNKGMKFVEIATGSAVLHSNVGTTGKHNKMESLSIPSGSHL